MKWKNFKDIEPVDGTYIIVKKGHFIGITQYAHEDFFVGDQDGLYEVKPTYCWVRELYREYVSPSQEEEFHKIFLQNHIDPIDKDIRIEEIKKRWSEMKEKYQIGGSVLTDHEITKELIKQHYNRGSSCCEKRGEKIPTYWKILATDNEFKEFPKRDIYLWNYLSVFYEDDRLSSFESDLIKSISSIKLNCYSD